MTHSHPLDLAIVEAVLRRGSFAWLGLIGSATKRRRFERQLGAVGLSVERLVCPIGLAAITGKAPAVIAASVTAQLLVVMEALTRGRQIRSVA
jgi:xanthine/CO dehydrogenase XdhC/CoxF family maturation factor